MYSAIKCFPRMIAVSSLNARLPFFDISDQDNTVSYTLPGLLKSGFYCLLTKYWLLSFEIWYMQCIHPQVGLFNSERFEISKN